MRWRSVGLTVVSILTLCMVAVGPSLAGATDKTLSTNFTLVNLGPSVLNGTIAYYQAETGANWGDSGGESFTIAEFGGQAIFRQYYPAGEAGNPNLTDGSGSVVVSGNQPMGAVVQVLARDQDPTTSGAYSGLTAGAETWYVPLAMRNIHGGATNSQIIVQNVGTGATDVSINLVDASGAPVYIKTVSSLAANASYCYDLEDESSANVPDAYYGSAVVSAASGGSIGVVVNQFSYDTLQTFNAFTAASTSWGVPLFTSRLANGLSSPLAVQNLSGSTIAAGGIVVTCYPDPACSVAQFTMTNATPVLNTAAYYFNPVTDLTIPEGFYGAAVVTASANVVVFVQMRFMVSGVNVEAAAYEAFPLDSTDTTVIVPLVAERLGNGFATAVTIQNSSQVTATMTLTYTPSSGGSSLVFTGEEVGPRRSLIENHRLSGTRGLPDGWYGTLTVASDEPINAFVQLTRLSSVDPSTPDGDNFMAHNAFTQP